MSAWNHYLDQIEARLQVLLEERLARWLMDQRWPARMQVQLSPEVRQLLESPATAPSDLMLFVAPALAGSNLLSSDWLQRFASAFTPPGADLPRLHIAADAQLSVEQFRLTLPGEAQPGSADATHELEDSGSTAYYRPEPANLSAPPSAYLILDGSGAISIQHVCNLGRSSENHIVLDDARISRQHAQIRLVQGHYVIFDLGSSGGTSVNGTRVRQQALRPGDVIGLSGAASLVFGLDEETHSDTTQQAAVPPADPSE